MLALAIKKSIGPFGRCSTDRARAGNHLMPTQFVVLTGHGSENSDGVWQVVKVGVFTLFFLVDFCQNLIRSSSEWAQRPLS